MRASEHLDGGAADPAYDPTLLGYVDAQAFTDGFISALLHALRTQIPARHLAGQSVFQGGHIVANLEAAKHRSVELLAAAREAHRLAGRAEDLVIRAETTEEENAYRARAATYRAENKRLTRAAEAAAASAAPRAAQGPFDAYTHVLVPALSQLAASDNRVDQQEFQALATIVRDLRVEHREGSWWGSAVVRVNTTSPDRIDGVSELGPIEWRASGKPNHHAVHTPSARLTRPDATATLSLQLEATGKLTARAIRLIVHSRHAEVPYAVLHALAGTPFPAFVGAEWREAPFVAHLAATYQKPDEWLGGRALKTYSAVRQAVLYYAEDRVEFTLGEAIDELWLPTVWAVAEQIGIKHVAEKSSIRRAQRLVEVISSGRISESTIVRAIRCRCGRNATVAVRLPEVPAELLCVCGLMPHWEHHGVQPEVRFPAAYLLRASAADCNATVRLAWDQFTPRRSAMEVLDALAATPGTQLQIRDLLRPEASQSARVSMSRDLGTLVRYDLAGKLPGRPPAWVVTDRGLALAGRAAGSH